MNFLEKIDLLKDYKGLNNHSLSIACGIPYTTIDGWYKKGYDRIKLSHLRKLGDCFSVSLDFLVRDDIDDPTVGQNLLSAHERKLIAAYREKENMRAAVDTLLGISEESATSADSSNDIVTDEAATIRAANNAFINVHTGRK